MCYRNLTETEVKKLQQNNCWTKNWHHIQVKEGFNPDRLYNVEFYGENKLGVFDHTVSVNGIMKDSGIKYSALNNCVIEDNVYINRVSTISNYRVKNASIIEDVGSIRVDGESKFGNGIVIEVLNEGGGRELPIYDNLTAQLAYLVVNYQHDQQLVKQLKKMIFEYANSRQSPIGIIGKQASIQQVKRIENVTIGAYTKILATDMIENGTVLSSLENATKIINARLIKNFIIQEGATIEHDAQIENCFIGQAVTIGKQYSAENSVFFANSQCFHGEACALFAGPYTVTHHKSSLLIAGLFSFYNAGSGTNQSNHMYKLGPLHQGILERGCKTGSFSYLLWPGRVGPFSAVMGKHYSHFDVSDFPFSYVEETDGESVLTPAMNLITVGTLRDSQKWPTRDKRSGANKRDLIHFDLFSPYIISKVLMGQEKLSNLYAKADKNLEYINLGGIKMKRLLMRTAKKYYKIPIHIFLGEELIHYINRHGIHKKDDFMNRNFGKKRANNEKWIDIVGLYAPKPQVDDLIKAVKSGKLNQLNDIIEVFQKIYNHYREYSWQWTLGLMEKLYDKPVTEFGPIDFMTIIEKWQKNKIKLNNMILRDADKEFDENSIKAYGIDGDKKIQDEDFKAVRGQKMDNSFVKKLLADNEKTEEIFNHMKQLFSE